jgi:hypothetical protein
MLIVFWWQLMLHHNSEKYNLSVAAFRLGWTQHIKFIFFIPIILMEFDPVLFFFICHQIEYSINSGFILNILGPAIPDTFLLHISSQGSSFNKRSIHR